MKTVKNHCRNCGYGERFTNKELFWLYIKGIFGMILKAAGILFLAFLIIVGPNQTLDMMSSSLMVRYAVNGHEDEVRNQAINWTESCYPTDTMCYSKEIFKKTQVNYVPASKLKPIQTPNETLTSWSADCKNMAVLYTSLMLSIGQESTILCSLNQEHCISKVSLNDTNYLIIDLTAPGMWMMNSTNDAWDYSIVGEIIN